MKEKYWSAWDFEGKISNLIPKLQELVKNNPDVEFEYELDYSGCYYESDIPSAKFKICPK